ncbi:alpha/beta fold hydrolase, partial [Pauljensenia sp. UMB0018B]|nr:alpha/beta fold hydrolase [Pauljensenia sp. UMB0018B]
TGDAGTDIKQVREQAAQFGQQCLDKDAELTKNLDTVSAAKDMDVMRAAVGDDKLTYVGYSYGTLLGSTYVNHFPKQSG